jgi:CRP-like cAMP-binding protein
MTEKREAELALLRQNRVFVGLGDAELGDVLDAATARRFARSDYIIHQGDPAAAFGVMTEGRAKLVQLSAEGHQIVVRYIKAGQEFGLIAALNEFDYPLSIQAVQNCELLFWRSDDFACLMQRHFRISLNALRVMVIRNQERQHRYHEVVNERVERRLARSVLQLGQHLGKPSEGNILIDISITREDLAELIGTTLFTVSRTLRQWELQGLVAIGRERIAIVDSAGLEQIAASSASDSSSLRSGISIQESLGF